MLTAWRGISHTASI